MASTPVKYARGVKLLIMVGQADGPPETFVAFCTINAARSVVGEAATNDFNIPDCEDPDKMGWLVSEKVSLRYTAQGAGILNTPDVQEFADWLADPNPRNCQIIVDVPAVDGGVVFAGQFHLTHFEITGDRGSKMEATVNLISNGEVTVTAAAALEGDDTFTRRLDRTATHATHARAAKPASRSTTEAA
jgi:tail tube protein